MRCERRPSLLGRRFSVARFLDSMEKVRGAQHAEAYSEDNTTQNLYKGLRNRNTQPVNIVNNSNYIKIPQQSRNRTLGLFIIRQQPAAGPLPE